MVKKWDLRIGTSVYLQIPDAHIKHWIKTGKIKAGEAVIRFANFSGWQKPEELEELLPFFKLYEKAGFGKREKRKSARRTSARKKQIKSILLIDDEKELCSLLHDSLSARGFQMECAHSKREAHKSLKRKPPDLVLLDLRLPDGDGLLLLTFIRKMSSPPAVIITTAYGSEEARSEANKMGAYDFLDKPYNEEDIIRRIRKMPAKAKRGKL
ncbi:MAG: response regulator [Candidatus Aminicenantes bacterium]|nr:response regulator [Candidatus Aminicenantes bacterium]